MAKAKIETFRIKDLSTGLYYTGGIFGLYKNPNYNQNQAEREAARNAAYKTWTYKEKKDRDYHSGPHSWNSYCKDRWNTIGKIFSNRRGAEKSLSEITGIGAHIRKSKAKNILFGNQQSNNIVIVPCRILDRVVKLKDGGKND